MTVEQFLDDEPNQNFASIPRAGALENDREFLQLFVDSIEQDSGSLFHASPMFADLNFLRGETTAFLTQNEETLNVIAEGSSSIIEVTGGEHDILLSSGELNLSQMNGSTVIYIDDFFQTKADIDINSGIMRVLINDPAVEMGALSFANGYIELDGQQTGVYLNISETQENSVLIENLMDGTELLLTNTITSDATQESATEIIQHELNVEGAPLFDESTTPRMHDLLAEGDIIPEVIYNDHVGLDTPPMPDWTDTALSTSNPETNLSFDLQDYFEEYLDLELGQLMTGNQTQEAVDSISLQDTSSSVANVDSILEMTSYESLEWDSAIEIIGDM